MARPSPDEFLASLGGLVEAVRAAAAAAYGGIEVTPTQAKLLQALAKNAPVSQASLSRSTGVDAALTGRVVETLLNQGCLRRKRSASDRRQYLLELSAKGQRIAERIDVARSFFVANVDAALEDEDYAALERVFKKIRHALDDHAVATGKAANGGRVDRRP